MSRIAIGLIFGFLMGAAAPAEEPAVVPLELVRWLPVEGPPHVQTSGLTLHDSVLYTVSDKHDSHIFSIKLESDKAVLEPAVAIRGIDSLGSGKLDLEGITVGPEGNFYLASEARLRILRVDANSGEARWVTPSVRDAGQAAGLFAKRNAYLEGITWQGENRFLLCAEREPRGLLDVALTAGNATITAFKWDETQYPIPAGRSPAFAGLHRDGSTLYALMKNANMICELVPGRNGYGEGTAWSYAAHIDAEAVRYSDMRYGMGEGLCMDDANVYVILDNNESLRTGTKNDRRPTLLIMKRPR